MAANIHDHLTDQLFKAILSLKDEEQCYKFFEDICTISELKAMAQRLEVATLLRSGRSYVDVSSTTGASSTTVSRVSKCLRGERGGYRLVLERLDGAVDVAGRAGAEKADGFGMQGRQG